jgi:hypothetical protein
MSLDAGKRHEPGDDPRALKTVRSCSMPSERTT